MRVYPGYVYHLMERKRAAIVLGRARVSEREIRRGVQRFARAVRSLPAALLR